MRRLRWAAGCAAAVLLGCALLRAGPARLAAARLALASAPAWAGTADLSAPGLDVRLAVRWQRPGWWRVSGSGGASAYDGRDLTVRLPGLPAYAAPGAGGAWAALWPGPALRAAAPGSVRLGPLGWPLGWRLGAVSVRYTHIVRVPRLPRGDFRLPVPAGGGAAPVPLPPGPPPARLRSVPGLRPEWRVVLQTPGGSPLVVVAFASPEGTVALAENVGSCSGPPLWVRTADGWLVHWCAEGAAFTARGPRARAPLEALVAALR